MPILLIVQNVLVILLIIRLIMAFSPEKRTFNRFSQIHLFIEIALSILFITCFCCYELSDFNHESYFPLYAFITILSFIAYWVNKLIPIDSKIIKSISLTFIGTLFWISLFTTYKFIPYYPLAWFPIYGLLALGPFFFVLLSLGEIRYQGIQKKGLRPIQIILLGLFPLIVFQGILNLFTPNSWELIKLFSIANF